ncbi:unnamed protein product, partial [marine sediment metagenome]
EHKSPNILKSSNFSKRAKKLWEKFVDQILPGLRDFLVITIRMAP